MNRYLATLLVSCATVFAGAAGFSNDFRFDDGWWNIELQGAKPFGFNSIHKDDHYFTGFLEYEFPAWKNITMGLRGYPLLYFFEKYDAHDNENRIYGAALGLSARLYRNSHAHDGWFVELASSPLLLTEQLEDNYSSLVFLNEIGFGYKFPDSRWRWTLKYSHISNAALAERNQGVDALVIGLGYRF